MGFGGGWQGGQCSGGSGLLREGVGWGVGKGFGVKSLVIYDCTMIPSPLDLPVGWNTWEVVVETTDWWIVIRAGRIQVWEKGGLFLCAVYKKHKFGWGVVWGTIVI